MVYQFDATYSAVVKLLLGPKSFRKIKTKMTVWAESREEAIFQIVGEARKRGHDQITVDHITKVY